MILLHGLHTIRHCAEMVLPYCHGMGCQSSGAERRLSALAWTLQCWPDLHTSSIFSTFACISPSSLWPRSVHQS